MFGELEFNQEYKELEECWNICRIENKNENDRKYSLIENYQNEMSLLLQFELKTCSIRTLVFDYITMPTNPITVSKHPISVFSFR